MAVVQSFEPFVECRVSSIDGLGFPSLLKLPIILWLLLCDFCDCCSCNGLVILFSLEYPHMYLDNYPIHSSEGGKLEGLHTNGDWRILIRSSGEYRACIVSCIGMSPCKKGKAMRLRLT